MVLPKFDVAEAELAYRRSVEKAAQHEQQQRRHDIKRRRCRRAAIREHFVQTRMHNYASEQQLCAMTRSAPTSADVRAPPCKRQQQQQHSPVVVKDRRYFNRIDQSGAWNNLCITPVSKLKALVSKCAVEGDQQFVLSLLERVEREDELDRLVQQRHRLAVAEQREKFRKEQLEHQAAIAAAGFVRPKSATKATTPVCTAAVDRLAQPRRLGKRVEALLSCGSSDMRGLLCTNDALVDVLPWHMEHARKQITASHSGSLSVPR